MKKDWHPLLRGKREGKYRHGFSSAEMITLGSICEAAFPPIHIDEKEPQPSKAVKDFFRASGAHNSIPDEVPILLHVLLISLNNFHCINKHIRGCSVVEQLAELVVQRGFIEIVIVMRLVLLILSTRVGTLLLCGSLCLGEKWPYINSFSSMSLEKREKVLQKWFKHRFFTPIRVGLIFLKVGCLYVFFNRVISHSN